MRLNQHRQLHEEQCMEVYIFREIGTVYNYIYIYIYICGI